MHDSVPPTALDRAAYGPGPKGAARYAEDRIAELEAAKRLCRTREERRPINQHIHTLRGVLRWYKTRVG